MTFTLFPRILRFLPALLCLGALAHPAAAQTPEPARFLLESIVVEGVQRDAPREIVVGESLLKPGTEYTEQELRQAVYRIKRLPFVVDATFSLRKGSERGAYELVITVKETSLFFYSASLGGSYDGDTFPGGDRVDWGASGTVGARYFVGSQGLVFGSVQGYDQGGAQTAQVGYTHFNLFGRGGFATVGLATSVDDDLADGYQGSFSLGLPLVGNHSIRVDLSTQRLDYGQFGGFSFESEFYSSEVAWIYDTTDDPLFPSTGSRGTASVGYGRAEDRREGPDSRETFRSDGYQSNLGVERYWALSPRQSIGVDLGGNIGRFESDDPFFSSGSTTRYNIGAGLLHSMDLWGFERTERIGDLRWENSVRFGYADSDSTFFSSNGSDLNLATSVAFRNTWGVMRLSFGYREVLDEDVR